MPTSKEIFRKNCLERLDKSFKRPTYAKQKLVNKKLLKIIKKLNAKNILFYYPIQNECDVKKSIEKLRKKNNLYLPFMEKDSFKMVTFRLPLERKKFGIFEPKGSKKLLNKIDLAIVPIVGVDSSAKRIGYGKGMYDRFFYRLKYKPKKIFIQYEFCYSKEIISDAYDITADYLLTPTRTYSLVRKQNGKRTAFKRIDRTF